MDNPLGHLLDALPDPLALLDFTGRVQVANAALRRLAGPDGTPRPGEGIETLVAPRDRLALAIRVAGAASGQQASALLVQPADPRAPAEARWAVECLPTLADGQVLVRVQDRSIERRAAEVAATAARLEAIGRLAGGIAHDFNNLLAVVLSAAEVARATRIPASAAEELDVIESAARRGADLVRQLLGFARQQPLLAKAVELDTKVQATADMLRRLLGPRVVLELACEGGPKWLLVDPGQLDQILLNLAANARQAMPEGGALRIATGCATFEVPVGPLPAGRWVVLEVADSGRGIPAEILPNLFEPFFTTRPDQGGTGLGLATVQGIVAQARGYITVDSEVGKGTRFRLFFPLIDPPEGRHEVSVAATPAAGEGGEIWLVEDEAALRRLTGLVLGRGGYRIRDFDDPEAALAAADPGMPAPAALVTDVAMPGMDGIELAGRLREVWPHLPVLVMSGYAEKLTGGALEERDYDFVQKPFAAAELLAALARLGDRGTDVGAA
jgi:two-component system cell cycle sensor histidine kinase/response regulator CckA